MKPLGKGCHGDHFRPYPPTLPPARCRCKSYLLCHPSETTVSYGEHVDKPRFTCVSVQDDCFRPLFVFGCGPYLLMPVVIEDGKPQLFSDIAILKQKIVVKSAKDVGPGDIEQNCLDERAGEHFAESDVQPSIVP